MAELPHFQLPREESRTQSTWNDATVTGVSPLRITLDGDTTALPFTPDSLVDPASLVVSDRVRCEMSNGRVIIVGRSGGGVPSFADWSALGSRMGDAESAIIDLETRTQGVIPSSVVVGSGSASVAADGTITFTGVSSISLNDVFDGLFSDTYECDLYISSTSSKLTPQVRFRAGGVDNTASAYDSQVLYGSNSNASAVSYTSDTYYSLAAGSRDRHLGNFRFVSPAQPMRTGFLSQLTSSNDGGSAPLLMNRGGFHDVVTTFDGFTLTASTGTMTGTLKVRKFG